MTVSDKMKFFLKKWSVSSLIIKSNKTDCNPNEYTKNAVIKNCLWEECPVLSLRNDIYTSGGKMLL